ncbi:MAG: ACP S-malonyltransferase, partial [Nitriliruptorales bacterium]
MTVAFVFPGQGAHREGMAAAWEGHPAHSTFDEVGRACGLDGLAGLADDREACAQTAIAQPAVFAASIAAWRALTEAGVTPDVVAGHS